MFGQWSRTGPSFALLLASLALLGPSGAGATIISGVEFSGWQVVDAPAGVDLNLHTPENLYIFIPNGLFTDQVTFVAEEMIIFEEGIILDQNDPFLCNTGCDFANFEGNGDVVLRILDPLGNVSLSARNIVVSSHPIPEPASAFLLASGLFALACWRSHTPFEKSSRRKIVCCPTRRCS
jgi:hypothetical protein